MKKRIAPRSNSKLPMVSLCICVAFAGCADAGGPVGESYTVRDSADVRIVTHHEGFMEAIPRWELDPNPVVEIGAVEGEDPYLFTGLVSALRLSDGRIVVLEGLTQELRFFDEEGTFLQAVGGQGDGPGEFRGAFSMVRASGDTLVVWDDTRGRITWISPEGELVRTAPHPPPRTFHVGGLLVDGSRILPYFRESVRSERPGLWRPTTQLVRVDQETGRVDTVGVWRGEEMLMDDRGMPLSAPAPRNMLVATSGGASHFAVSDTEDFDIGLYSGESGQPKVRIRRSYGPRAHTEDELEAWRGRAEEEASLFGRGEEVARTIRTANIGNLTVPAVAGLHLDREGSVWVLEYPEEGSDRTNRLTVFGPDGVPKAVLAVPVELEWVRILEAREGELLVIHRDQLDVLYVRAYRVIR